MSSAINAVLSGAVAMASLVATLFFLRFWRQTRDTFFLFFAMGFALDAAARLVIGLSHPSNETEPLVYILRLIMFGLIIVAITLKNTSRKPTL